MENLFLKGAFGMYTVLPQALHGGIIRVSQTQFSSLFLHIVCWLFIIVTNSINIYSTVLNKRDKRADTIF